MKNQLAIIVTLAVLLGGGLVTWGRIQEMCTQIEGKADKEPITRELDLIHEQLAAINARLDGVVVRTAIIEPAKNP